MSRRFELPLSIAEGCWGERTVSLPLNVGVSVVAQNPIGIVALQKPPGIRTHPNDSRVDGRALLTCPYNLRSECYNWQSPVGDTMRLHLLNRLDSPTSGVLLAALNEDLAEEIRAHFAARRVQKRYFSIVEGSSLKGPRIWRDSLRITRARDKLRVYAGGGERVETEVRLLQARRLGPPLLLLELRPRTGRTHQLRVQCAYRGYPVVGDATYGDLKLNRRIKLRLGTKRLFLHSNRIAFELRFKGKKVRFRAEVPMPETFETLLSFSER